MFARPDGSTVRSHSFCRGSCRGDLPLAALRCRFPSFHGPYGRARLRALEVVGRSSPQDVPSAWEDFPPGPEIFPVGAAGHLSIIAPGRLPSCSGPGGLSAAHRQQEQGTTMSYLCRSAILRRTLLSLPSPASCLAWRMPTKRSILVAMTWLPRLRCRASICPGTRCRPISGHWMTNSCASWAASRSPRSCNVACPASMSTKSRAILTSRSQLPRFHRIAIARHAAGVVRVLDGVRVNEAFGDVVHWDLIPAPPSPTCCWSRAPIRCTA